MTAPKMPDVAEMKAPEAPSAENAAPEAPKVDVANPVAAQAPVQAENTPSQGDFPPAAATAKSEDAAALKSNQPSIPPQGMMPAQMNQPFDAQQQKMQQQMMQQMMMQQQQMMMPPQGMMMPPMMGGQRMMMVPVYPNMMGRPMYAYPYGYPMPSGNKPQENGQKGNPQGNASQQQAPVSTPDAQQAKPDSGK